MTDRPSVLYVCVHNAGRSQMAAAYTRALSGGAVEVRSAGSAPADSINPAVHEAMLEEGIDLSAERPKVLTTDAVQASDVVITMGWATPARSSPASATRTGRSRTPPAEASTPCARSVRRSRAGSASCSTRSESRRSPPDGRGFPFALDQRP